MRHNSYAFFDGDDFIDRHIRQFIHVPAWPSDHQRFYLGSLAEAKMNARIACRHIARTALCLLDMHKSFRGQLQSGTDAVAVGFVPINRTSSQ